MLLQFLNEVKANSQNQQPNIILFLVDDMGWQDKTPS